VTGHGQRVRPPPAPRHPTKVEAEASTFAGSRVPRHGGSLIAMTRDLRVRLSTLWIVILLNMIYADILSFLNADFLQGLLTGHAENVRITQTLLVASAVVVEIPILMVLLSRVLPPAPNRWVNLVAVPLTAAFVIGGGSTRPHYLVLAGVELVCLGLIAGQAWRWRVEPAYPNAR
jgi:hypothetical protein